MRLFRDLRALISPPKASETPAGYSIPFDFTPDEWSRFKALVDEPDFDLYLRALDEATIFSGEAILGASRDEHLHFYRGFVAGLRKAAFIVNEARQDEKAYLDEQSQRAKRAERSDSSAALFGSPGWRPNR